MARRKKKKLCYCTPNCKYFPQEVPKEDIDEIYEENGVLHRKVRRHCMYEGGLIKSWSQPCYRKIPDYINPPKGSEMAVGATKGKN